jgi:hypothetical protein
MGLIDEITGKQRGRVYSYRAYLDILSEGVLPPAAGGAPA